MLMEELATSISLNIATCWLILKEFELAKRECDFLVKLDLFNVKAQFWRP